MVQDAWRSRTGFLLAALGSAIGLGNIWRFPYMAYKNGGGAFLIPYALAVVVVGFSLVLAEFAVGHRFRASQPTAFGRVKGGWEGAGWWAIGVGMLGITLYYMVVIAWTVNYFFFALTEAWQPEPKGFFFKSFLGLSEGPGSLGWPRLPILAATVFVWAVCWWVVRRGIARGIELASLLFMPILGVLLLVLVVWSLTLPGAGAGLKAYFAPDFSKLLEARVWGDAVAQTFFSLSVGFGILVAYSRYLPERSNLVGNAAWVALGDTLFAIIAGVVVFATMGFMAHQAKVEVGKVVTQSVGLAFIAFPQAISQLPGLKGLFGALFFLALFLAGITSAISLLEALASALQDKFGIPRRRVVTAFCCLGCLGSLLYTTGAGLFWLDIVDHHATQYGLVLSSILMAVFAGWLLDRSELLAHVRRNGGEGVGEWWPWLLRYVVPLVLGVLLVVGIVQDVRKPYEGYPVLAILLLGWGLLVVIALAAYWATRQRGRGAPRASA
ncbi:MAG: sodium-dependent transporter [Nitrospinota bacterium]